VEHITYGPGGYDPAKPASNVISVEETPDPPTEPDPLLVLADQVATLTDAVDTLILDSLGGLDV
jgi:hypothetical protein